MSPWGKWLLSHIDLDAAGLFYNARVLNIARALWPAEDVDQHWYSVLRSSK